MSSFHDYLLSKNSSYRYILRKKKIPTNESACKCRQRHNIFFFTFACVMFAGTEGLACAVDKKGQKNSKLGSSLSFLSFLSGNETLFVFEIAA